MGVFNSLVHSKAEAQTSAVDRFHLNIFKVSFSLGCCFLVLLSEVNEEEGFFPFPIFH